MKKFTQFLAVVVLGAGLMGGVASADCSIVNTGQGSTNTCVNTNADIFTFVCTNTTDVVLVNGQSASSGSVVFTNNTGGATYTTASGNAVNVNSVDGRLDIACGSAPAPVTPVTPTTPTPEQPAVVVAAAPAPVAASLPQTGSNALVSGVVSGAVILVGVLLATQLGAMAYRRLALK